MDVGEKLKEARLAKDISLDSLQEKTKIQKDTWLPLKKAILIFFRESSTRVHLLKNMRRQWELIRMKS